MTSKGPINITHIDTYQTPPRHDYTLTLTFKANTWGVPVDPELAAEIQKELRNWNEGRYPFMVEMIQQGLSEVVKMAIYRLCDRRAFAQTGNEMVETGPGSFTSKAHIEGQEAYKAIVDKFDAGRLWLDDEPEVKIEQRLTEDQERFNRVLNMTDKELMA